MAGGDVLKFSKYQGLGNDFIVVESVEMNGTQAVKLCDRRFGIGGDGVLCLSPSNLAAFQMRVYNSDGSIAEMCGNGLRCLVRHIARIYPSTGTHFSIETDAGVLETSVDADMISVKLGLIMDEGIQTAEIGERAFRGRCLSTGNPHFVIFGDFTQSEIETFGPQLEWHSQFPRGANVSFARASTRNHVDLTVWERGCGLTLACGTGASATVTAGWLDGHLNPNEPITVTLPGGTLTISGTPEDVVMTGPAVHVFDGVWSG